MIKNQRLQFFEYSKDNFLDLFGPRTRQTLYLEKYISELDAMIVLREPNYFDRDYLAEFASFYSVSSKGYPNICERLHFFSEKISRRTLIAASGGSPRALKRLQGAYLGFIVKRPIPAAPLGRTVLKWYPDNFAKTTPRVPASSRKNFVHIAGVELYVEGLAWQQQDSGVGACATVSLWSMLQSSAFDDHHAIPTTADITQAAHKRHSFGTRMFPSKGLNIIQVCEVINERDLVPLITEGDVKDTHGRTIGFSKDRFASTCAAFIRSGYPVLIVGRLSTSGGEEENMQFATLDFGPTSLQREIPQFQILRSQTSKFSMCTMITLAQTFESGLIVDTKFIQNDSMNEAMVAKPVVSLHPEGPPHVMGNLTHHPRLMVAMENLCQLN